MQKKKHDGAHSLPLLRNTLKSVHANDVERGANCIRNWLRRLTRYGELPIQNANERSQTNGALPIWNMLALTLARAMQPIPISIGHMAGKYNVFLYLLDRGQKLARYASGLFAEYA